MSQVEPTSYQPEFDDAYFNKGQDEPAENKTPLVEERNDDEGDERVKRKADADEDAKREPPANAAEKDDPADEDEMAASKSFVNRNGSKRSKVIVAVAQTIKDLKRIVLYCLVQVWSSTDDEDSETYLIPREELEKDSELLKRLEECNGQLYHELRSDRTKESAYLMDSLEYIQRRLKDNYRTKTILFHDTRNLVLLQTPQTKLIDEWFRIGL